MHRPFKLLRRSTPALLVVPVGILGGAIFLGGCARTSPELPHWEVAANSNRQFLEQKSFDPWVLTSENPQNPIPAYGAQGDVGGVIGADGAYREIYVAGRYRDNQLQPIAQPAPPNKIVPPRDLSGVSSYRQTLNLRDGTFETQLGEEKRRLQLGGRSTLQWQELWKNSDIVIEGDPEAQQVTHANLFYLLSSTFPGSTHSLPPMGFSSSLYKGRIFWDAEIWMLPALVAQHPEAARSIVDYRFRTLPQARANARARGFPGAEYAWESAATGKETALPKFAAARHITAAVAFAAWQYYLWTGDREYLAREGWPILQATAQYWAARAKLGRDGKFHIRGVVGPDEISNLVDDNAYTNAAARANLRWATRAAKLLGKTPDPLWAKVEGKMFLPVDKQLGIIAAHAKIKHRHQAKQADTMLLLHPLNEPIDAATSGRMLDWYSAHTDKRGPAMTNAIHAVVAAQLGRSTQALQEFRLSYRPFMRAPWAAFSEKRVTSGMYFLTGMSGSLQSILYGFAGLQVRPLEETGKGRRIAFDGYAALWANPHLPPGWKSLKIKGIRFRGQTLDLTITEHNDFTVQKR